MHLPPLESRDDDFYIQMSAMRDTTPAPAPAFQDPLHDVFGSDPDPDLAAADISMDTRRLQTQHTTVGYREGITAGKSESIQAGFDSGFSLGANIGLKAGQLLGLLEGIPAALAEGAHSTHANRLLADARTELSTDKIFDEEYWAPDGSWRYAITGSDGSGQPTSEDVANEHPLILKWSRVVEQEMRTWSIDPSLPILKGYAPVEEEGDAISAKKATPREVVDW
ncbi:Uu.00g112800.m01.CDS01 [Anthostomella pinea]|uniref:Protein YAE1 n=1 Tax=Anthostomella pinea TaxID=933095 RepID=A0AAI8YGH9_9PEZI|nr:Uu.00g112800.m01.CDS01 [Anthostomella pinea]